MGSKRSKDRTKFLTFPAPCAGGTTKVRCGFNLWFYYDFGLFCRSLQQGANSCQVLWEETGVHVELCWDNCFISFRALNHLLLPAAFIFSQCKPGRTTDPQSKITELQVTKPGIWSPTGQFAFLKLCISHIWLEFSSSLWTQHHLSFFCPP